MDPTPELAKQLERDKREAADAMTFEQRAMAGVAMFDLCLIFMRAGIRMQNPGVTDEQVESLVVQRLRSARRYEAKA